MKTVQPNPQLEPRLRRHRVARHLPCWKDTAEAEAVTIVPRVSSVTIAVAITCVVVVPVHHTFAWHDRNARQKFDRDNSSR